MVGSYGQKYIGESCLMNLCIFLVISGLVKMQQYICN